jgi:hypothetical protein
MEQEKKVIKIISGKRNERVPQLLRLIGTVDINGKGIQTFIHILQHKFSDTFSGTTHELAEVDPFILLDDGASKGKLPFGKHPHQVLIVSSFATSKHPKRDSLQ